MNSLMYFTIALLILGLFLPAIRQFFAYYTSKQKSDAQESLRVWQERILAQEEQLKLHKKEISKEIERVQKLNKVVDRIDKLQKEAAF